MLSAAGVFLCALLGGCKPPPPPLALRAPYPQPRSLAVLPLMNQSPSSELDTLRATDALVEELMRVENLVVYPTNQPLKVLIARGHTHPTSLAEAAEVARSLGADGVVIGSINDYEPYPPQKISMTLQLYWLHADMGYEGDDPVRLSRSASLRLNRGGGGDGHGSQVQGLYDASSDQTVARVRVFAQQRNGQDSPYGWRRFLVDSEGFMHFACREMVLELMDAELKRITVPVAPGGE